MDQSSSHRAHTHESTDTTRRWESRRTVSRVVERSHRAIRRCDGHEENQSVLVTNEGTNSGRQLQTLKIIPVRSLLQRVLGKTEGGELRDGQCNATRRPDRVQSRSQTSCRQAGSLQQQQPTDLQRPLHLNSAPRQQALIFNNTETKAPSTHRENAHKTKYAQAPRDTSRGKLHEGRAPCVFGRRRHNTKANQHRS